MKSAGKHDRYKFMYKPNEVYWGLGIENETYLELEGGITKSAEFLKKNHKRERYSVDYWTTYKPDSLMAALKSYCMTPTISLPLLINSHTFMKTDMRGEPKSLYRHEYTPNPKFSGMTLFENLQEINSYVFKMGYKNWWTFDGDTIEFMTQKFYCAKMEDVITELLDYKKHWLSAFKSGLLSLNCEEPLKSGIDYPKKNHGFAVFLTNRSNVGIFNNGTYHFNITLPTRLTAQATIADMPSFVVRHRMVARLFQWISPFLVAAFGSGDVLASCGSGFPAGSQRLCASRYVSVGTFDTAEMPTGKILTQPYLRVPGRWYERIHDMSGCAYTIRDALGVDINFNKHWNHGLEFRVFDWFPESRIEELFRLLIWMCDEGLSLGNTPLPQASKIWNGLLAKSVAQGAAATLSENEATFFGLLLRIPRFETSMNILDAYAIIRDEWRNRWNNSKDSCTSRMIRNPLSSASPTPTPAPTPAPAPAPTPAPAPAPTPAPAPAPTPSPPVPAVRKRRLCGFWPF